MTINLDYLDGARFDPRRLEIHFPADAIDSAGWEAHAFFSMLEDAPDLTALSFLDRRWRDDDIAMRAYRNASPEGRLEIHAIIGALLHETTHQVDVLISPFGVQYLLALAQEYLVLQDYIPRAVDRKETLAALSVLANLTDGIPDAVAADPALAGYWKQLERHVSRQLAWGDLEGRRAPGNRIARGWPGFAEAPGDYLGIDRSVELIAICGHVLSYRPEGVRDWYVRPATFFETKALCNVMLHIMDLSGNDLDDLRLYYRTLYGYRRGELAPDYLFVLDAVASIMGPEDFDTALESGSAEQIRSLLLLASGLSWFALQAPPIFQDGDISPVAANPTVRLMAGLRALPAAGRDPRADGSAAGLCLLIEESDHFRGLEQAPIAAVLENIRRTLDLLEHDLVPRIWNPGVRDHFLRIIGLMRPHFDDRPADYRSAMGMPNDGNVFTAARTQADWELVYSDQMARDAMAEWLDLRQKLLFSFGHAPRVTDDFVTALDAHFMAKLILWPCAHCDNLHTIWYSRFAETVRVPCPLTGQWTTFHPEDVANLHLDPE